MKTFGAPPIDISCLTMEAVSATDLAGWERLRHHHPHGLSPLLSPSFAKTVSRLRRDVRVLIARKGGDVEAVLPVHARPFGFARPIGAPFDDLAGPLCAPRSTVTMVDLLAGAGFGIYKAQNAIQSPHQPEADTHEAQVTYAIDRRDNPDGDLFEARKREHPKRFKNFRRLSNRLERDLGQIDFRWGRPEPVRLARLLEWKSRQFQREGLLDITSATHSRALLKAIADQRPEDFTALGGFVVELHVDGNLIAGHFGVREGAHFHSWISAYDPDCSKYAPGMVLLMNALSFMGEMGLDTYQLANGHGHYKKYFATPGAPVISRTAIAPGLKGTFHSARQAATGLLDNAADNAPGARLVRRLDHIAVCEPSALARTREMAYALVKRSGSKSAAAHPERA